MDIVETKPG